MSVQMQLIIMIINVIVTVINVFLTKEILNNIRTIQQMQNINKLLEELSDEKFNNK